MKQVEQRKLHRYKFIGEYLVEAGLLTEAQVGVVLKDQYTTPMTFGEIIATRGWVKSQTIEYLMKKIIEPERQSLTHTSLTSALAKQPSESRSGQNSGDSEVPSEQSAPTQNTTRVNWIG